MRIKKTVGPVLIVILLGGLLIQLPFAIAARGAAVEWFDPIIDVRHLLMRQYVEEPDEDLMQRAMIDAMIGTLDDPYTVYVPPFAERDFNKDLRGKYVGIGSEVRIIDGELTIITPMDDSPSLEAGVRAGDVVLEIAGTSTKGKSVDDCIELLLGEAGTPVEIRVRRTTGEEEDLTIVRRQIVTRTVEGIRRIGRQWDYFLDEDLGIAYVALTQFNETSVPELRRALGEIQQTGLNGLVFDLRGNPGGELSGAIDVSNLFLDGGEIVSVEARRGEPRSYSAERAGTLPGFPMVVIVNAASASASEIVAGALKENDRAKVIGTRTYGKGSVQEVHQLPYNRGILKLTSAKYYLSSGRNINRESESLEWGVDPSPGFVMQINDLSGDDMLKWIQEHRQYETIRDDVNLDEQHWSDASWIHDHVQDWQLAGALEAIQTKLRDGEWPVVGGTDAGLAALEREFGAYTAERNNLLSRLEQIDDRLGKLHELTAQAGRTDILPADADTDDGTLTIRDRHGNVIGAYRIESGNLEYALQHVELQAIDLEN